MGLAVGTRVGQYEVLGALGAGGMGEVYRARDTRLQRDVALKILPEQLAHDPDRLERFEREARVLASLNHPNIALIFGLEESSDVRALVMELVEGQSLDRAIPEGGLSVDRILDIAGAIAAALTAAHDKGIVHRDLKPANVMVTTDGRVKVLDFGLAKELREVDPSDATFLAAGQTQAGVVMGTPAYMSPEQVAGRAVDHRSDLFSLGVVLYELASGRRPFEGDSSAELASAILRDAPRPLADVRADLPADLARIIRRCLEKDPRHRLQTARDVSNELRDMGRPRSARQGERTLGEQIKEARGAGRIKPGSGAERLEEGFWVAVLPFKYTGTNADLTALADGLSEEVVTGLSRFSYLRVIARSSTVRFATAAADVREVGAQLGARYVMEGSLRQAGSVLRLAVQLLDASSGAHLSAETYTRPFQPEGIFALQDDLVPRIVSTVADRYGVLPHTLSESVRNKAADDLSPYEAVLRSFGYYEHAHTAEEHAGVRAALERAVQQAPGYADAWAMLSMMYAEEYGLRANTQPDSLGRALQAARRAADAAPSNHCAYLALAQSLFFRKEFPAFRIAAERAIALNPMDGSTVEFVSHLIAFAGNWDRGCELADQARQLNPHHPGWYWATGFYNAYRKGDYRDALGIALKINMPGFFFFHVMLAAVYGQLGERQTADKAVQELRALEPDVTSIRGELEKWYLPELVEHLMDGLAKAGLDLGEQGRAGASTAEQGGQSRAGASRGEHVAIAVLPFVDMSAAKDQEYFCDGMAEEIINALTRMPGLRVIARTSAFRFRGEQDLRKVGEALGVRTVLEGSVRKSGNTLRITAQLIEVADDSQVWSERFDRELVDVFAIQDEIAAAIVEKLHLTLGSSRPAAKRSTANVAAYEALLEARHHFSQFTPTAADRALTCLRRALSLDPDYTDALVVHALYHIMLAYMFGDPLELLPRARALAGRALELDKNHGEAQAAVAIVAVWMDRDWSEGEGLFGRALALAPASARVHELFGLSALLGTGRLAEALAELDRAVELDPLSALYAGNRGRVLTCSRRFVEAEASCRRGLAIDPGQLLVQVELMYALTFQHRFEEAMALGRQAIEVHGRMKSPLHALAVSLALAGEHDEARRLLDDTAALGSDHYQSPLTHALVHAACSEMDAAFECARRAIDERDPLLMYLEVHPMFDLLRADARYPDLVRRMNLD